MRHFTVGSFIGFETDGYKTHAMKGVIEYQPNGGDYNVVLNTGLMVSIQDIINNAIEARNIVRVLVGKGKIATLTFKTYFNGMAGWSLSCDLGANENIDWDEYAAVIESVIEDINEEEMDYTVFEDEEETV